MCWYFTDNLATQTSYGVVGTGLAEGTKTLNNEFANWTFRGNVIVGAKSEQLPRWKFLSRRFAGGTILRIMRPEITGLQLIALTKMRAQMGEILALRVRPARFCPRHTLSRSGVDRVPESLSAALVQLLKCS